MEHILTTPKDPQEAFYLATQTIPPKKMASILNCSLTHIYRMRASKNHNGETRNNPFSQSLKVAREYVKSKMFDIWYSSVLPLVTVMPGAKIAFENRVPDKEHFHGEIIDFSLAAASLQETCRRYVDGEAEETQMRFEENEVHSAAGQLVEKAKEERIKRQSN